MVTPVLSRMDVTLIQWDIHSHHIILKEIYNLSICSSEHVVACPFVENNSYIHNSYSGFLGHSKKRKHTKMHHNNIHITTPAA